MVKMKRVTALVKNMGISTKEETEMMRQNQTTLPPQKKIAKLNLLMLIQKRKKIFRPAVSYVI